MKCSFTVAVAILVLSNVGLVTPFGVSTQITSASSTTSTSTSTVLLMAKKQQDDDLLRAARASRTAGSDDNVVELMRPLGLVLNQDENGNVYVETVAPKGNAARTGKVRFSLVSHCPVDNSWCRVNEWWDLFRCWKAGAFAVCVEPNLVLIRVLIGAGQGR